MPWKEISLREWMECVVQFYPFECSCGGNIELTWIGEDDAPEVVYYACGNCEQEYVLAVKMFLKESAGPKEEQIEQN